MRYTDQLDTLLGSFPNLFVLMNNGLYFRDQTICTLKLNIECDANSSGVFYDIHPKEYNTENFASIDLVVNYTTKPYTTSGSLRLQADIIPDDEVCMEFFKYNIDIMYPDYCYQDELLVDVSYEPYDRQAIERRVTIKNIIE